TPVRRWGQCWGGSRPWERRAPSPTSTPSTRRRWASHERWDWPPPTSSLTARSSGSATPADGRRDSVTPGAAGHHAAHLQVVIEDHQVGAPPGGDRSERGLETEH